MLTILAKVVSGVMKGLGVPRVMKVELQERKQVAVVAGIEEAGMLRNQVGVVRGIHSDRVTIGKNNVPVRTDEYTQMKKRRNQQVVKPIELLSELKFVLSLLVKKEVAEVNTS
ncbi:hypothetical protein AB685_20245 [Bacillus sp. LL01]|uniref:hypothetical protein n=1 Tax=Bacillus sp. LL01 TaxID=1665556 RepID=UPI00064D67AF|nr:hypothetical protein [Bacillus sp. LL01]KMJ56715.1 hypothetical protein AB685_20245 [Bacillus sp. LL01]